MYDETGVAPKGLRLFASRLILHVIAVKPALAEAFQPVNQGIMPDIIINCFLHRVGNLTVVCHFGKDSGLEFFYGHILWRLGPVKRDFRFYRICGLICTFCLRDCRFCVCTYVILFCFQPCILQSNCGSCLSLCFLCINSDFSASVFSSTFPFISTGLYSGISPAGTQILPLFPATVT